MAFVSDLKPVPTTDIGTLLTRGGAVYKVTFRATFSDLDSQLRELSRVHSQLEAYADGRRDAVFLPAGYSLTRVDTEGK